MHPAIMEPPITLIALDSRNVVSSQIHNSDISTANSTLC